MKRLMLFFLPFFFWNCGNEGVYLVDYTITNCSDSETDVADHIDVFHFKDRITLQEFKNGILNLHLSFMDDCSLDMLPGVESYGDTIEVSVDSRIYRDTGGEYDVVTLCDCCFGLDMKIGGIENINPDSLVVILNTKNKYSYPDTFQLVVSDEVLYNYDKVDFAIVFGDTLFYEWEDEAQLNDSLIRVFRDEDLKITSSFENDYGINYDRSNRDFYLRAKYGRYYLRDYKNKTKEFGVIDYGSKITLPTGQVGYEVFFVSKKGKIMNWL